MEFKDFLYKANKEAGPETALSHARYWIQAVEYQGKRLTMSYKNTASLPFNHTTQRMEEQFFLNAVGKAIRWLRKLTSYTDIPEVNNFLDSIGDANFIRDMREHDDEYLLGTGRKQEDEMAELKEPGRSTLIVGQGVTVFQNGQVLLGGRLNVTRTTDTAASLAHYLVTEERKQVEKKWHWIPDTGKSNMSYLYPPDKLLDAS